MRVCFSACLKSAVAIPVENTNRYVVEVDVEPRQEFCKYRICYFFDFDNKKKYYMREGETSVGCNDLKKLYEKVQENADRSKLFRMFFWQSQFLQHCSYRENHDARCLACFLIDLVTYCHRNSTLLGLNTAYN